MKDHNGVEITEGCRVRQRNVFHARLGALKVNAQREGTVGRLFKAKVEVQFDGRTAFNGFTATDEPKIDRVHAQYLEVLPAV